MRVWLAGRRSIVVALIAVAACAGAAAAYWTGVGLGSTQTQLADTKSLTLSVSAPSADLYPGGSANVSSVVSNPNPYVVHISSLALDAGTGTGGFDVDGAHSDCSVGPLGFTTQTNAGKGWTVPPKAGSDDGVLPIEMAGALTMGLSAANSCQGATFTIHLEASP